MRSDMHKVIVERPRVLRSWVFKNKKTALRLSASRALSALEDGEDFDSGPCRASSSRHAKWLNENLAPLRRYLHSQIGRPWDKVYAEIREGIDTRSAIGLHVMQHLDGFVSIDTLLLDGAVYEIGYGGPHPVRGLYVDPRTGILRCTKNWRKRKFKRPPPEPEVLRISDTAQYELRNGLWFRMDYRLGDPEPPYMFRAMILVRQAQCDRKTIRRIEQELSSKR